MLTTVSRFTGTPVKRLSRVRGVYSKFPHRPGTEGKLAPHADHIASQLSAMVLVVDVPPRCGGFTIWPGSHRLLHPHWDTVFGSRIGPDRADRYQEARDSALREITPLEFPGSAGDVVFWHPRLIHSTGVNHSAELGRPILRLVVPCDYQRDGGTWFDDVDYGPGSDRQGGSTRGTSVKTFLPRRTISGMGGRSSRCSFGTVVRKSATVDRPWIKSRDSQFRVRSAVG